MSRSTQKMKELKTGTHLVIVSDAKVIAGGLRICFTDGFNKSFEHDYSLDEDKAWIFNKMCAVAGIDRKAPQFKKEAVGKRLWIAIKEVHDGDKIDYYIFDTLMCFDNPEQRPIISGDPIQHPKGIPLGVFIEYKNLSLGIDNTVKAIEYFKNETITSLNDNKAKVIAEAREMIKKVEGKEMTSLNQPNKPKTASPDWDDF